MRLLLDEMLAPAIARELRAPMPGTYRRTLADVGRIVDALKAKLKQFPSDRDLANSETWL